jgi:5-formyltetrahydrofolate cyclo-ligase
MKEKKALRSQLIVTRDALETKQKSDWDHSINTQLQAQLACKKVETLHTFLPMGNEVGLYPVIEMALQNGITVVTPRAQSQRKMQHLVLNSLTELEEGIYGTHHPANSYEYEGVYDFIIVPGLAFDLKGNRLGYGAGYYDTFLKDHVSAYRCGVAYPFQLVDQVPCEPHDIKVDQVIVPQ